MSRLLHADLGWNWEIHVSLLRAVSTGELSVAGAAGFRTSQASIGRLRAIGRLTGRKDWRLDSVVCTVRRKFLRLCLRSSEYAQESLSHSAAIRIWPRFSDCGLVSVSPGCRRFATRLGLSLPGTYVPGKWIPSPTATAFCKAAGATFPQRK